MTEWMMLHPGMTFFLILAAIEAVGNAVADICTAIASRIGSKGRNDQIADRQNIAITSPEDPNS